MSSVLIHRRAVLGPWFARSARSAVAIVPHPFSSFGNTGTACDFVSCSWNTNPARNEKEATAMLWEIAGTSFAGTAVCSALLYLLF